MDPRVAAILARGASPAEAVPTPPPVQGMDWVVSRVMQDRPQQQSEIGRICSLPIAEPLSDAEVEALQRVHVKEQAYEDGFRLQRVQVEALQFFIETGGLFAPIQVGGGKTLISLRCVGIAVEQGIQRICLFVPSQVYSQLVNHDIAWARRRVPLGTSFYQMGGKSPARRMELAGGRRGCWIIPYSLLSTQDSYTLLEKIRPELMIFDEAHHLKNRDSARTKRIRTYWRKYRPKCVCLSGTMTAKSLNDYAHLLMMSLGQGAPVPLEANMVQEWAATLDSEQANTEEWHKPRTSAGPLRPLINWSNDNFPATQLQFDVPGFRHAFQNRLLTTPGVVSSPPDALGTSIVVENLQADRMAAEGGSNLTSLLDRLNNDWVSPSGDELDHAMQVWKCNNELTAGIYNALVWPDAGKVAESRNISVDFAEELLTRSKEYHRLQQEYHRVLRQWFSSHPHRPGLDTPMLVGSSMAKHGSRDVGTVLYDAWRLKESADFEGRIERQSVPMRVCDYKIQKAISWAKERDQGIVWYWHQVMGDWLFEKLVAAGINAVHCPAGKQANDFLTSEGAADRCSKKILVCSIAAHGTGKNLQFMTDQIFVQLPVNELSMEQAIGRTHRKGQTADEVIITTLISSEHDRMALGAILNDAIYVRETMNSPRKVLIASWNPMPTTFGSEVLIRAGAQATLLTARQQQLLRERFQGNE